jgi:hypothetical protein
MPLHVGANRSTINPEAVAFSPYGALAHELLRQAPLILGAGWSKGCDARVDTRRMVPLHVARAD